MPFRPVRLPIVIAGLILATACAQSNSPQQPAAGTQPKAAQQPSQAKPEPQQASEAQTDAPDRSPELQALIEAANKEGQLKLVWSDSVFGGGEGAKKIQAAMNEMFGTNIQIQFSPGPSQPQVASQIIAEHKAGQKAASDVYYGAGLNIAALADAGALERVEWTKLLPGRISAEIVELDQSIRQRSVMSGFAYNTQLVDQSKLPNTMEDMLDPYWTGKVATTPYVAGFDFLAAPDAWGPEKTIAYLKQFSKQVSGMMRCGETERIASGEVLAFGLDCGGDAARTWADRGAPVAHVVPIDAAQLRYFYLAVPKNATNPSAAKLFTTFMMTKEGQELSWQTDRADLASFPDAHMREIVQAVEKRGAKFFEPSIKYLVEHPEMQDARDQMVKVVQGQ